MKPLKPEVRLPKSRSPRMVDARLLRRLDGDTPPPLTRRELRIGFTYCAILAGLLISAAARWL